MWRQVQGTAGLAVAYRDEANEQMRTDFHALQALAFVPVDDVEEAFDSLAAVSDPLLRAVFDHVEDNYLRGRLQARRRGARVQVRGRPMFPPPIWNCYERTAQGLPRTTNTCEAWHRRINTLVGKHHPSMFVFLDQLRDEIAEADVLITRAEAGHSPPKRRTEYEMRDDRIARIVRRYEDYKNDDDVVSYLRAVGHNIAGNI